MSDVPRIAVGYDASAEADLALGWAVTRAEQSGAQLVVVRAVHNDAVQRALKERAERNGHELVDEFPKVKAAQDALGADRVEFRTVVGHTAATLIDISQNVDLVVVGTRGRGALASGLVGSTSYAVAGHCDTPVVVVRAEKGAAAAVVPGPSAPIAVGVEDVDTSRKVLDIAARYAESYGAEVMVVRATSFAPVAAWTGDSGLELPELQDALDEKDDDIVADCVEYLRSTYPGLKVTGHHADGEPAEVLVEAGAKAGLLVVGSRGRGGFKGLLLGSVSHAVIHQAHVPVMVVR